MKVTVDLVACESQAVCIGIAPTVFDFDDQNQLVVLRSNPPESMRDAIEEAAAACPLAAILVEG